jgi:hypothetical protein
MLLFVTISSIVGDNERLCNAVSSRLGFLFLGFAKLVFLYNTLFTKSASLLKEQYYNIQNNIL